MHIYISIFSLLQPGPEVVAKMGGLHKFAHTFRTSALLLSSLELARTPLNKHTLCAARSGSGGEDGGAAQVRQPLAPDHHGLGRIPGLVSPQR